MLIQALLAFQQQVLINYYTWTSLKEIMFIHLRIKVFISIIAVLLPSLNDNNNTPTNYSVAK